jgi:hypothetical protein
VRYHRERLAVGAVDGRSRQMHCAAGMFAAISHWIERQGAAQNLAALHDWLVAEFDYPGSLRSVQRYVAAAFPLPARRLPARRRRLPMPAPRLGQIRRRWPLPAAHCRHLPPLPPAPQLRPSQFGQLRSRLAS